MCGLLVTLLAFIDCWSILGSWRSDFLLIPLSLVNVIENRSLSLIWRTHDIWAMRYGGLDLQGSPPPPPFKAATVFPMRAYVWDGGQWRSCRM